MLMALLRGVALPAGQLAMMANVAPQTASSHLSKLVAGRLLAVEQQGRHRYYRLADAEVGAAIEALLAIHPHAQNASISDEDKRQQAFVGTLQYARTCYSHLAGQVAVRIAETLERKKILIAEKTRCYRITQRGRDWLEEMGIEVRERDLRDSRFARRCLDWTERRHHLAGVLGSNMLKRSRELKWIVPIRDSRAVRVTHEGQRNLEALLRA